MSWGTRLRGGAGGVVCRKKGGREDWGGEGKQVESQEECFVQSADCEEDVLAEYVSSCIH